MNKVFTQDFAVGAKYDKNQLALVTETFVTNRNTNLENRQWYAGVQYGRSFSNLMATGTVKIHLNDNTYDLVFEPGVAYNLNLSNSVILQPAVGFPIYEGTNAFKPVAIKAGVGLQFNF